MIIKFPKKYLLSETPLILFLWIISVSLVLSLIAFLFLRIQIRAIQRLAKSAEDFGAGKRMKKNLNQKVRWKLDRQGTPL